MGAYKEASCSLYLHNFLLQASEFERKKYSRAATLTHAYLTTENKK